MKSFFINDALDKAIKDYLSSKNKPEGLLYNSFLVCVVRMLINIYGELDIINPYQIKNEKAFDDNLMKYGAKREEIDNFKRLLDGYYLIDKRNKDSIGWEENNYFVEVQKCLIDFFTYKRLNFGLTEDEANTFFDLLSTPGSSNFLRISDNYLNSQDDIYAVARYYQEKMKEKKEVVEAKKYILGFDVYKLFNLSISDISKLSKSELDNINNQIYESFDINKNALNKEFLLEEKIKEIHRQNNPITTGNGYVDILLVMSVVITTVMVIVIFSTIVF